MKFIYWIFAITFLFLFSGCIGKDTEQFVNGKITFELLTGANQTEKIGRTLPQPIKLKIYKDGNIGRTGFVAFKKDNCSGTIITKTNISNEGIAEYSWRLDDKIGEQKLIVYAYFDNVPLDSIIIKATATDIDRNNYSLSSCLETNGIGSHRVFSNDTKTTLWAIDGRVAMSVNGGRSWQYKYGFYADPRLFQVAKDAIYWVNIDTLFSAQNAVSTQTNTTKIISQFRAAGSTSGFLMTPTNKCFVSVEAQYPKASVFMASDPSTSFSKTTGIDYMTNVVETTSGRLFCTTRRYDTAIENFFYSDDSGLNWKPVAANLANSNPHLNFADNLFISSKNEIYAFSWSKNGVIYKSTNNGNTWTFVKNNGYPLSNIQEYKNEFYYFENNSFQNTLLKTTDFVDFQVINSVSSGTLNTFIVSSTGIVSVPLLGNLYFKQL